MAATHQQPTKPRCPTFRHVNPACFLGNINFAGFTVGNEFVGCYRYDVAIKLMSGRFCRSRGAGRQCELSNHVHDQLRTDSGKTDAAEHRERNMLVLSRKTSERILIGDDIAITIVRIGPNSVRIGIEAPKNMNIVREELCDFSSKPKESADVAIPIN
jgi:carbon storage regulator